MLPCLYIKSTLSTLKNLCGFEVKNDPRIQFRYMFDLSDESTVWAYIEIPCYQYFWGASVFGRAFPINRSAKA